MGTPETGGGSAPATPAAASRLAASAERGRKVGVSGMSPRAVRPASREVTCSRVVTSLSRVGQRNDYLFTVLAAAAPGAP